MDQVKFVKYSLEVRCELRWPGLTDHFTSIFLKAAFHKFYLAHFLILCLEYFYLHLR